MKLNSFNIVRRDDGAILVYVRSDQKDGRRLPDAVFAFRRGDPQYEFWEQKLRDKHSAKG